VTSGIVSAPAHFQFVLGTKHGLSGSPENMFYLKSKLPPGCTFAVAGVGRHQLQVAPLAIVSGGHVRVGFEDNVYFSKGVLAKSNAQLVGRVKELSLLLQREVATAAEARGILGIV
ncbi:MAG: 3-keto-5-aminohexanoate cleavage protein, partial [Bdellovibrionota bacterium]